MELVLHTGRLQLTPLAADDVDLALEMYTDPEVLKFTSGVMTEPEIRREMSNWTKRGGAGGIGTWCITDSKTGEKLGETYLLPLPIDECGTDFSLVVMGQMPAADIEIGYFFKRSAWSRGYATEVCKRMLRFAFEDVALTEVVASVHEDNLASINVLQKAGLRRRGRKHCHGKDSPIFRITHDEWIDMRPSTEFKAPGVRPAASQ